MDSSPGLLIAKLTSPFFLLTLILLVVTSDLGKAEVILVFVLILEWAAFLALTKYLTWVIAADNRDIQELMASRFKFVPLVKDISALNDGGIIWIQKVADNFVRIGLPVYVVVVSLSLFVLWTRISPIAFVPFLWTLAVLLYNFSLRSFLVSEYSETVPRCRNVLRRITWEGWIVCLYMAILLFFGLYLRLEPRIAFVLLIVVFFVSSALLLWLLPIRNDLNSRKWNIRAVYFNRFMIAWTLSSFLIAVHWGAHVLEFYRNHTDIKHETARATRQNALRPEVVIAVTLSGGGFRAVAFHTGVLASLEKAHIPISYLSTVSGGSIAGALYAHGWTPQDVIRYLAQHQPPLANDFLNVAAVLSTVATPYWSRSQSFYWHLRMEYLHNHLLAESGPPFLIVNATNYETGSLASFDKINYPDIESARSK